MHTVADRLSSPDIGCEFDLMIYFRRIGLVLVVAGLTICLVAAGTLRLMPLILNRIRIEERMLTDEFGDAYRRYKERTSKLIRFVY